jgi:hypothetical protein
MSPFKRIPDYFCGYFPLEEVEHNSSAFRLKWLLKLFPSGVWYETREKRITTSTRWLQSISTMICLVACICPGHDVMRMTFYFCSFFFPLNPQTQYNYRRNTRQTRAEEHLTKYLISTPQNCQHHQIHKSENLSEPRGA